MTSNLRPECALFVLFVLNENPWGGTTFTRIKAPTILKEALESATDELHQMFLHATDYALEHPDFELSKELIETGYVVKPIVGRCGANIRLIDQE